MLPHTLVALACMIANKDSVNTSSIEAQLSKSEKAEIESIIHSGACLPENMEDLVKNTNEKIKKGQLEELSDGEGSGASPVSAPDHSPSTMESGQERG